MHDIYLIGTSLEINYQSKKLIHRVNNSEVALPVSGCFCLQALAECGGNVLSLTELMDIGWGHAGVEVSENSVRVMISKIRNAVSSLEMQHEVVLLTVPRSGYRLLVGNYPRPELLPETGKNTSDSAIAGIPSVNVDMLKRAEFSSEVIFSWVKNRLGRLAVLGSSLLVIASFAFTNWITTSSDYDKIERRGKDDYLPVKDTNNAIPHFFNTLDYPASQDKSSSDG